MIYFLRDHLHKSKPEINLVKELQYQNLAIHKDPARTAMRLDKKKINVKWFQAFLSRIHRNLLQNGIFSIKFQQQDKHY